MEYLKHSLGREVLQKLDKTAQSALCREIRTVISHTVEKNGGHLASNLGVVELTVALNTVFDFSSDKIFFDVGHQCYAHKLLNGRLNSFETLRKFGGISGFPDPTEHPSDTFSAGHSGTALSAALGACAARDRLGQDFCVVAVLGDGSLTSGQVLEALNNIGEKVKKLIIIINDNGMSISQNVGALTRGLTKLRLRRGYRSLKRGVSVFLYKVPLIGKSLKAGVEKIRDFFRNMFTGGILFEHYNVKYSGTFDGHNIRELVKAFSLASNAESAVLLHVITKKGMGDAAAENFPERFHGVKSGKKKGESVFSREAGKKLTELAGENPKICAVTAAMAEGTGLSAFAKAYPDRFFDVGIAEQHATTFTASLADGGLKPYFAVYSSFLQRAYDQLMLDICVNNLPAVLLVDRSGIAGSDGKTHQGIYDASYLSSIPGLTVVTPKDIAELNACLELSVTYPSPLVIRYGVNYVGELGKNAPVSFDWEVLKEGDVLLVSSGNYLLNMAVDISERAESGSVGVVNARVLKPLDFGAIESFSGKHVIVFEDSAAHGGLFSALAAHLAERPKNAPRSLKGFNLGDAFIPHGTAGELLDQAGITVAEIMRYIDGLK